MQRTEHGIAALHTQLATQKTSLGKLLAARQATLDSLTTTQQGQVGAGGVGGSTNNVYTGPISTQAEKAVAFAYASSASRTCGARPGRTATTARAGPSRRGIRREIHRDAADPG